MQSLLLERKCGRISNHEFVQTVTESLYSSLRQVEDEDKTFPTNCHGGAAVNSLALETIDHRYMFSGCADSSLKLWDLKPDEDEDPDEYKTIAQIPRKSAHQFGVSAVKWWPFDTGLFTTASFDHTVKIWDTNNLEVAHTFDLTSRVYSIAISASQQNEHSAQATIAVASDQPFIRLLDLRAGSSAHTLPGHKGKTLAVDWHPNRPYLLALGGYDGEAKVWDIRRSDSCLCRLDLTKTNERDLQTDWLNLKSEAVKAHAGPVNAVLWDEMGTTLYTAGNDDKVRVWDMIATRAPPLNKLVNYGPLTRNKYLQSLPLMLSPQNETEIQHLLFPSDNGDILVFRAADGKLVSRLQRGSHANATRTASMVYAGPFSVKYFCGTMDGEIIVWEGGNRAGRTIEDDSEDEYTQLEAKLFKNDNQKAEKEKLYDDPYFKRHDQDN